MTKYKRFKYVLWGIKQLITNPDTYVKEKVLYSPFIALQAAITTPSTDIVFHQFYGDKCWLFNLVDAPDNSDVDINY